MTASALDRLLSRIVAEHEAELSRERPRTAIPENTTCGARTRAGTPCKRRDIYASGRCALHGGLSTGPRTPEGREQSRINGRKGGRPRKNPTP